MANSLDQAITLQTNTLLGKLTPVAWVAGITQRRPSSSHTSKLPEELQKLLNRSSNDLSSGEVKEVRQFLHEFKDRFTVRGQSVGRTSFVQHRINTGDRTPIRQPPRRPPLSKQEEMSLLIQVMLTEGNRNFKCLVFSCSAGREEGWWIAFLRRLPEVK